jgi:hypothetical protein
LALLAAGFPFQMAWCDKICQIGFFSQTSGHVAPWPTSQLAVISKALNYRPRGGAVGTLVAA